MIYYLSMISFFTSLVLVFIFWKIGERYKIYDLATKDPLKIHQKSISCLGGLAMFLTIIIVFSLEMILKKGLDWQILGIMAGGILLFLVGFGDDLKWRDKTKIKPLYKFFFLILFSGVAALVLSLAGMGIEFILAFIFIFILINAINYQDGIDGLASGLVIISLIGFLVLAVLFEISLALFVSLVLIGAIAGFLFFNFPPAKVFMGDSGAYFLGFILAVLTISFFTFQNFKNIIGPIFILGLPLFDGIFTNIRRLFKKKSIFLGDREHFYDKMINKGFSNRETIFISYSLQLTSVLLGLLIYFYV